MSIVGHIERVTQNRVVGLFRERLGYEYLGDWTDRVANSCVEDELLKRWLDSRGVPDALAKRAIHAFHKAAEDTSATLTNRNRSVYNLLRYGVKLSPASGERYEIVWLVDWKNFEDNHFAVAEEGTVAARAFRTGAKSPPSDLISSSTSTASPWVCSNSSDRL